jgi:hypothetical protein
VSLFSTAEKLDVYSLVGSTFAKPFYVTHVECLRIEKIDAQEYTKHMARQRCVGASDKSTG